MQPEPFDHAPDELAAARRRVHILVSWLYEHRALATPRSQHWYAKEAEHLRFLARAQVELDRLERELLVEN